MEKYARNDTHYLRSLEDRLKPELKAKGRLTWHQEACSRLISESTRPHVPDADAVWRIKGSHLLGRGALAALREIWLWRENEAITANRPPFFIMSHEALVHIAAASATQRPIDPLLPKNISERRKSGLTKALARAREMSPQHYPRILERVKHHPTEAERKRFLELEKRRDARAAELAIDPTLIASRATLSDLARKWDKYADELMKWQRELLQP